MQTCLISYWMLELWFLSYQMLDIVVLLLIFLSFVLLHHWFTCKWFILSGLYIYIYTHTCIHTHTHTHIHTHIYIYTYIYIILLGRIRAVLSLVLISTHYWSRTLQTSLTDIPWVMRFFHSGGSWIYFQFVWVLDTFPSNPLKLFFSQLQVVSLKVCADQYLLIPEDTERFSRVFHKAYLQSALL